RGDHARAHRAGDTAGDLALDTEQIGGAAIDPVGPEMRAGFGIDQLRVDAYLVAGASDAAFEHVANLQLPPDLLRLDRLALVGEGRIAGDDKTVLDARQVGGQVLGNAVSQVLL